MMDDKRLTVLQLLPALHSGGVERGVLEVAEALVAAGHRSLVVSQGGPMVDSLVASGSEHFACPIGRKSPTTVCWIPWLRSLILREHVDVVDYHSRLPGWITLAALRTIPKSSRPACVSSLHGMHSVNRYSGIMCQGDVVVVVSETLREYVVRNYPWVDPGQIRVIHRGLDDREFPRRFELSHAWRSSFEREFPAICGKRIVAIVGRLTRLKGHAEFVRLIAGLRHRGHDVQGLIVGSTQRGKEQYRDEIVAQIESLGMREHVTLTGGRSDLKEIYRLSDVVVSLSGTPESFGRTVAEALAVGTPVVGYDHGGVAEILRAEFPEGAIPVGDESELAARVGRLLVPGVTPQIAVNQFSLPLMQQRTVALYEELAGLHREESATVRGAA